eukprot:tig00000158_g10149.t1
MAARCPGVGKQPRIRSVQNQDASAAFRARVSHQEWIGSAGSVGPKTAAVHSCLNRPSPDARYSYLNSRWLTRKRSDARRWRQLRQLRHGGSYGSYGSCGQILQPTAPRRRSYTPAQHESAAAPSGAWRVAALRRCSVPCSSAGSGVARPLAALLSRHAARSRVPGSARRRPASSALSKEQRRLELEAAGLPP